MNCGARAFTGADMGICALEWKTPPDGLIPQPLVRDDAESFAPDVVAHVRQWLEQTAPAFDGHKPTAQTLSQVGIATEMVVIPHGSIGGIDGAHRFKHATAEVCLIEKATITIRHRFMVAREINALGHATGRDIAGPKLLDIQDFSLPPIELATS